MAEFILMPSLSPTMEEGVLQSWAKKVGDLIKSGTVIANIETDKAIVEYESLNEGYLRQLLVQPGAKVVVGQPIAIISEDPKEAIDGLLKQVASPKATASAPPAAPIAAPAPTASPANATVQAAPATNAPSSRGALEYDVAVIGAGPGGYVAAIRAAQLGLKVALIDKQWMGGVCLNVGCIPSKTLLKNADVIHTLKERGKEFGFAFDNLRVDYSVAVKRSRDVSNKLTKGIAYLCKKNHITVHLAEASFKDANTVQLKDKEGKTSNLTAKNFIIATGANARMIPGVNKDGKKILTYWEAILQETLPKSVVIVGSGAIGVEFATVWNAYGTQVTIVEMLPGIVPLEDREIGEELKKAFIKRKIAIHTNTKVEAIDTSGKLVKITVSGEKGKQTLEAEQVLVAIGFMPNSTNIGLEKVGVQVERGAIKIDDQMRTNVPNIYAIGDVTAKLMLAHVGSAQGILAAETIAGKHTHPLNYEMMPRATYCHPQVASFGITESQAKERGHNIAVGKFPFSVNGKALGLGEGEGFLKIIVDKKYGEILGAHLIGPEVTELLPEFTLAQAAELTIEEIAHNVHAHPTLSEVIMEAAHGLMGGYIHL